jgi:hypothetical protein
MKPPSDRQSAWSELEQQMLDAARRERVPTELRARMHDAFLAAAARSATNPSAATADSSTTRLLFSKAGMWGSLAVVAMIACGGVALWSSVHVGGAQRPRAAVSGDGATTRGSAEPSELASSMAHGNPTSIERAMAPARVSIAHESLQLTAATPGAAAPSTSASIQEELSLLDRARVAVRAHDAHRALGLLDDHSQRFAQGVLLPEAQVLRIEALTASGETQRARALGRSFLQQYSGHPLADHVSKLIARR